MDDDVPFEKNQESLKWGKRHVQTVLLFLCMLTAYGLRVNLSVAIVAMTNKSSANEHFIELPWDESTKSLVLSSFFWGYPFTQVIAGQMCQKYGAKYFLIISISLCAILTIITPISAIHGGVIAVCLNRMVQGMAQGVIYPAINVLLSKWAPLSERSRISSFVFSGSHFGSFSTLPVAGLLSSSVGGWPSVFYVSGFVTLLWVLAWYLWGANGPESDRSISKDEKDYIVSSLRVTTSKKSLPTPWRDILLSVPVWMLIIVHCTQNWGAMILLTNMPSYLTHVLKFNIKTNGYFSALPHLLKWMLIIMFSWISDYITARGLMTQTAQKKMWNSIAHWGGAAALFSLYMFDTSVVEAMVLLTAALGLNGGVAAGFMANHLDLAPNFAGTLFGISNTVASFTSILGPLLVGFMVTDNTNKDQWGDVFLYSSLAFFVGNLLYVLYGSSKVQPWNQPRKTNEEKGYANDIPEDFINR